MILLIVILAYILPGTLISGRELFNFRWRTSPQPSWRRILRKAWWVIPFTMIGWAPIILYVGLKESL
jgi:hypothetical protein